MKKCHNQAFKDGRKAGVENRTDLPKNKDQSYMVEYKRGFDAVRKQS